LTAVVSAAITERAKRSSLTTTSPEASPFSIARSTAWKAGRLVFLPEKTASTCQSASATSSPQ
jgi:hypothetical protein